MKKVIILIAMSYFFQLSAMEEEESCYAILGINESASEQEIKEGLLRAVDFYKQEIEKQRHTILKLQKTLNDIFAHPNQSIPQKKITKLVTQTNAVYLKIRAHIKDPIYKKNLSWLIDTNIYRLASYFFNKDNFKQATSILNRHILTISKKDQTTEELIFFRDRCAKELAMLKQECIPVEPPSNVKLY